MKKLEKIAGIMFAVAIILKIASLPGAGILISTSLGALACFYLFFGFAIFNNIEDADILNKEAYKGILKQRIAASIIAGWGFSAICIGALFELMRWPGGVIILPVGLVVVSIITFIAFIYRTKSDFFKTFLYRFALGFLVFSACFIFRLI